MFKIRVDLYNPSSGKWKYGDLVTISGAHKIWDPEFLQELVDNQQFVQDGTFGNYDVVVSMPESLLNDPSFIGFYAQLYRQGTFR